VRANDLFAIDVAAEVATLCDSQLQGPWQVPAELVRLANARGAARVEIKRARGGLHFRCDGVLASREELQDLVEVFDLEAPHSRRQAAISRVESAGLSALLWAIGLPGARLTLLVRTGGWSGRLVARGSRIGLEVNETDTGPPSTTLTWRCRGLGIRRAVAWLRTALRFVPIPVTVCGRQVERGFQDGLYRMRIADPLPGEIAVTASGDAPRLWLLEHGVLSARAVVPGYPAFSAAVEMSGEVPAGSSADTLRAAANPHLERLIDESVRMLLLLVDRLPTVKEPVRERLATLLLRAATLDLRREQVLTSPIVSVREGTKRRMESPSVLARRAVRRGGVMATVEPGSGNSWAFEGLVVEATTEERSLLAELLDIRIENIGGGSRSLELVPRIVDALRRGWQSVRGLWGPQALQNGKLTPIELRLLGAASEAGVELSLCEGSAAVRRRQSRYLVGRNRPEVQAAALALATGGEWLYPALLAVAGEDLDIPDEIRNHWLEAVTPDNYEF
jgi:hypothetical protein